jgi:arylformamidase
MSVPMDRRAGYSGLYGMKNSAKMNIYDISVPISNATPVWPDDPSVKLERRKSIEQGDVCNLSAIAMCVHSGTHIDAPLHFIDRGRAVDAIPLEVLNGPCRVIETGADPLIEKSDIEKAGLEGCRRVLFKTKNSEFWRDKTGSFREDFVSLGPGAAKYLVEQGIVLVGIDYLSIESFHAVEGNPVHTTLLRNNIVILETIDLSGVHGGEYELLCLPLKIEGADGTPVRAILRDINA